MTMTREEAKRSMIITRIWVMTRKKLERGAYCPVITWEEAGWPFQYYRVMDLRARGLVVLSEDMQGRCGFYLKEGYWGLSLEDLKEFCK